MSGRSSSVPQNRLSWVVIFAAMLGSLAVYCIMGYVLQQSGSQPPPSPQVAALRQVVYAAAILVLLASVLLWNVRTRAVSAAPATYGARNRHLPPPGQFQTVSIVTMALAEAAAVLGLLLFFLGAGLNDLFILAGASAAVMLLVVLPRGLRYWSIVEAEERDAAARAR